MRFLRLVGIFGDYGVEVLKCSVVGLGAAQKKLKFPSHLQARITRRPSPRHCFAC